ncbi:MAG: LysR family transcriptional regulator [Pelagibacteraceae bacterium]|nr:LysR family transcriptional regulator [Pelagibacteraceae bacterium]|tara:strand:+ start:677 stop:1582 length:906 start_codon:yes stop_codon:yes gene_type:complete
MNIALVDLNLLIVFDAVMREQHVTKAAKRIGMTQPAVSNALNRLRYIAKDDLFIRSHDGVIPTARAIELGPPIRQAISLVENAFDPTTFDPKNSNDTFNIAISNYTASILFPKLAEILEKEAPNIDVRSKQLGDVDLLKELEAANIDFIIAGQQLAEPENFISSPLYDEDFVCVMRKGHPFAKKSKLTLKEFAQSKHLMVATTGKAFGFVDYLLETKGLKRRVAMTVNQFLVAPAIIRQSNMVLTVSRRVAEKFRLDSVKVFPLPLPTNPLRLKIIWHKRSDANSGNKWIREKIINICKNI